MRITPKGLEVRVIKEPEFSYTKDGVAVWKALSVLSKRMQVGKRWEDDPDYAKTWIHVVVFGDLAEELADREVGPGSILLVREGRFVPDKREGSVSIIAESASVSGGEVRKKGGKGPAREEPKFRKVKRVPREEEEYEEEEEERPVRRRRPVRRSDDEEFPDESDLPF